MRLLIETARLTCGHAGIVDVEASQGLVFVGDRAVLVKPDVEAKTINLCPIPTAAGTKPCLKTQSLRSGYSGLVFIEGIPVCRMDARGFTNGVPPKGVDYFVVDPGQGFVAEEP